MKKGYILGILFFGSLWGFSEAMLGGLFYRIGTPLPSVYLTIIGVSILIVARVYLPGKGVLSAIAAFAMLYKFLNSPIFACHFLGILLLGICCDLFFNFIKFKNKSLSAMLAVYINYALFAVMMVYVFRYSYWIEAGSSKVLNHIFVGGTLAAIGCALAVPFSHKFGLWLQKNKPHADLAESFARVRLASVTTGMWLFALAVFMVQ